jgi:beta-lactamase regulating signal transducer with metallopeptidase domain
MTQTLSSALLTFLLNSLWQVPLVAAAGWLASTLLRRSPASYRHGVWMLTAVAALVLPLSSVRVSYRAASERVTPIDPSAIASSAPLLAPAIPTNTSPAVAAPVHVSFADVTARGLLGTYFLFILWRLIALGTVYRRTMRLREKSVEATPSSLLATVWKRAAAAFQVNNAELRVSSAIPGPVMIGGRRKSIILPEALFHETDETVLTTAIGHEMAHISRRDYELNILAELLCVPISFQPATLLIRRAITRSREVACDELVTRRLMSASDYARSMVTIAHDMVGVSRPGYSLGVFDGNILEERVKRLLEDRVPNFRRARLLLAAGLCTLAVCIAIGSAAAISARAQSAAIPELRLGGEAFNHGDYQAAADHFRNAVNLEPDNVNARLFLAQALVSNALRQPVRSEGAMGPALQQYEEVLARDPKNATAILGIARLGGPERWQQTHGRLLALIADEPGNALAYYTAGVMDWQLVFQAIREATGGAPVQGAIPDVGLRSSLRAKYQATVDEGIRMIQTMLQISPSDSSGFAYLNLLYREVGILAETAEQSKAFMAKADEFVQQALATRKTQPPTATTLNVEAPAPRLQMMLQVTMQAPPPPPPPPPPGYRPNTPQKP